MTLINTEAAVLELHSLLIFLVILNQVGNTVAIKTILVSGHNVHVRCARKRH